MNDEFFDDEQELMEAQLEAASEDADTVRDIADARREEHAASEAEAPAPAARLDAPPFWMVLAIAVIALVLGIVIGYLIGTSATLAELESASSQMAAQSEASGGSSSTLPEGHPDLSINEDGTATLADGSSDSQE